MRKILFLLLPLLFLGCKPSVEDVPKNNPEEILQDGDIIFQESTSSQSRAIQLATHSKYSHCGIIFKTADECYVFEAIQPVQSTPLEEWIKRGKDGHYVVKRLKNADDVLTGETMSKMKRVGGRYADKDYDPYFGWSDDKIYCSELVWKIYKHGADIELGEMQKLTELDFSDPVVKQKLAERYGDRIPRKTKVISPGALFDSKQLETVISN